MEQPRLDPSPTSRFLGRLKPLVRPYAGYLAVAGVFLVLSTLVGLAFPLVVRELLDAAFLAGDSRLLNRIAMGLLALFVVQAAINFAQSYLTASVSERVVADLRNDVFESLVRQPPGYFARRRVGELSSRLASDVGLIQNVMRFGIPELLRQGIFLLGAMALITATNPRLTLVTLTVIPVAIVVAWLFGRRVRKLSTGIQDRLAGAVARAEQVFTQITTVQSFTREGWEARHFRDEVNATRDEGLRRAVARAALTGVVTFAAFGAIVMVLWEGGRLVLAGQLSPGTLVAFLLYAVTIAGAITSLAGFWSNLQEAAGAAERIFEVLGHAPELRDPEHPVPLPDPVRGEVSYRGVTFRYGPELPLVLAGIDLELRAGETVALVGSSGAGKSTLASLIPRFFEVEDGAVLVDGIDVREVALESLRRSIGLVPQEPMLFAGTVADNLRYGDADATQGEIEAAARAAHAHAFISGFPDGYEQTVGERGVTLSAGQRQRIAIARVMLSRPRILVLDEASSSLDAESEALVQDALEHLMEGRTTLVIAHRLSTVIRADRILVLDGGEIVDQGCHAELLERSEVYRRLYRRQFHDHLAARDEAVSEQVVPEQVVRR
ncbi:MAG: ABC transporter transmembrane domain-containing protein [Gemmatimonadota bacterium]|nr:ABC transporter transmembrane domain-containing protein [Gemmatimonadota bacterium]MDH5759077.1 ABC transporter transmembrane domain-containing protein [Gemmatimonadota bacterium]